jgi:hypothetical protein
MQNYSNCYIGVTNNPELRWNSHVKSGYTVSRAINENGWNFEDNMQILFSGDDESCFDMESKLRPMPLMGLNEAAGGRGGRTSYTPERGKKISQALSGKGKSEEHRKKISLAKTGVYEGENNPRAVSWVLIDPQGNEHKTRGNLQVFCEDLGLCWTALRANVGMVVGEISPKFRDNGNPLNRLKRANTIGWKLIKEN